MFSRVGNPDANGAKYGYRLSALREHVILFSKIQPIPEAAELLPLDHGKDQDVSRRKQGRTDYLAVRQHRRENVRTFRFHLRKSFIDGCFRRVAVVETSG